MSTSDKSRLKFFLSLFVPAEPLFSGDGKQTVTVWRGPIDRALATSEITDPTQQLEAALFRVSAGVLDEWRAHAGAPLVGHRATLDTLVDFLKVTYESACNAYMASTALAALRFDARDDIAAFNKEFTRLLGLAELEEGGSFTLNLYRQAMPEAIRRELFGGSSLITRCSQINGKS
ncbi:hypothetical protein IWQ56_001684, partial [Coemansia nantahalensis]